MYNKILVSVIIPTYRRYDMLTKAVNSVLSQTLKNLEILVIDDYSMDNTAQIAKLSPKVKYICNPSNRGPGYSRHRGLEQSKGDYIVFLDDDDYYTDPLFLSKAVNILEGIPDCIFVAANAMVSYEYKNICAAEPLNISGQMTAVEYLKGFPFDFKKPHSTFTTVFRKETLLSSGVADMRMLNDMPLYMRSLTAEGSVFFMDDTIGVYRIHNANISKSMTWNFIQSNLEEKFHVKKIIEQKNLFSDIERWWIKQIEITMSYLVYGSYPSMQEWKKARKWCLDHSISKQEIDALFIKYKNYLIDYKTCKLKSKIKKMFGIKQ